MNLQFLVGDKALYEAFLYLRFVKLRGTSSAALESFFLFSNFEFMSNFGFSKNFFLVLNSPIVHCILTCSPLLNKNTSRVYIPGQISFYSYPHPFDSNALLVKVTCYISPALDSIPNPSGMLSTRIFTLKHINPNCFQGHVSYFFNL